jgi:hypothetical protein
MCIPKYKPVVMAKTATYTTDRESVIEAEVKAFMAAHPTAKLGKMWDGSDLNPKPTQTFHQKDNLKLVYQSILPTGVPLPDNNVVFQYTDEEENKICRCICRMS